jgi:hypothetical protein
VFDYSREIEGGHDSLDREECMTVEELIEELQRQPNRRVPVVVERKLNSEPTPTRLLVSHLRFEGKVLVVETGHSTPYGSYGGNS